MKAIFLTLGFLSLFGLAARTHEAHTPAPQETAAADLSRLHDSAKQSKDDPEPWREYAEALDRAGDARGAVKAFGEAVKRYDRLYNGVGASPGVGPTREAAARNREQRAAQLRRAPETIARYIQLGGAEKEFERQQLEAFAAHARMLNETDPARAVFGATELDRKARITDKPAPNFSDLVLSGETSGVVRLRAVLAGDGTVKHVYVLKGPRGRASEAGVAAAYRVKFEPALKDGKPASQFVILEYRFGAY